MKYEHQLKILQDDNTTLQETLKKQDTGDTKRPEAAVLEEEWIRRFSETREMYEEAIQGYKDQLEQTQRKLVVDEQNYAQQVEQLMEQLKKAQSKLKVREGEQMDQLCKSSGNDSPKDLAATTHEGSSKGSREDPGSSTHPHAAATSKETVTKTDKMYGEALELIVSRLENLQVSGEEVEGIISIIKNTINTSLQEWRDSFHQARVQPDGDRKQLQVENEELQRKLKGKNKKIETLQKQTQEHQHQNEKLLHRCSLLESRVSV